MHFWIDKRSQTCGFSGRHRIPPSLSGGCGQQRRRRRRSRGKLMVTPVHRFQPIESTGLGVHGRRGHHHRQLPHSYLPPGYTLATPGARNGAHAAELDSSVFLDIPLASHGETPARIQPANLVPVGTLRCGIWASFALATVFVAGIKLYFDHQGSGLEVLVFFALLVVFLLAGCTASMCRSRLRLDLRAAPIPPGPLSVTTIGDSEIVIDDEIIRSPSVAPVVPQPPPPELHLELPPPPYHIAILLPQQQRSSAVIDESPPPSYDKVVG